MSGIHGRRALYLSNFGSLWNADVKARCLYPKLFERGGEVISVSLQASQKGPSAHGVDHGIDDALVQKETSGRPAIHPVAVGVSLQSPIVRCRLIRAC